MNNPLFIDVSLHWTAVVIYIFATLANTYGLIFEKAKFERFSYWLIIAGLLVHSGALAYRWLVAGHGPYMVKYEVLSSNAWTALVIFLIFTKVFPRIRPASIFVFPGAFLLLAIGIFVNPEIRRLPPTLSSIWLVLHVTFYKIALGTLIIALAFSVFYLMKNRNKMLWLSRLPDLKALDLFAFRFVGFGFVFWAIGMLSGSIWAYQSWGRFWGWDPVENWSLFTWALFGMYLHLRRFFSWQGRKAAFLYIFCFTVALTALFFTPVLNSSIHAEYFR